MSISPSALVAPGAIVAGKYRLDALIGEGGMGSVWSAMHVGLGQAVAIKLVSRELVRSAEALRRFDAEAKAAAQLRSRHVVQVFDNGTLEDGTPYIAMELLRGESLYTRIHRDGPVTPGEAVEILWQCCKALGRAHAAGIVHRDIKPDNIFLSQSQDDDALCVKILDFGIAKFAANPNDQGSTRTGAVLGTPLYMSPEQARGLKTIDHRTDLYSLGLVAYTMLTGNLAFSSDSFGDLLLQICTAPLPSLCAGAPALPPAVDVWFSRACARAPEERFASAQEFADALRVACGSDVRAPAPSLSLSQSNTGAQGVAVAPAFAPTLASKTTSGVSRNGGSLEAIETHKSKAPLLALVASLGLLLGVGTIAMVIGFSGKGRAPAAASAAAALVPAPASPPSATGVPTAKLADLPVTNLADAGSIKTPPRAPVQERADLGAANTRALGAVPFRPSLPSDRKSEERRPTKPAPPPPPKPIDLGY
ncbi:MAG: serine/threonine-protein kinase [Polyangiaceae bacterium]